MKQKDIMYLLLAVVILLAAGFIGYTKLVPKKADSLYVEVEKVGPIPSSFSAEGLARIGNSEKVHDFSLPVDLTGLDNVTPFGK